jgi:large subunit ribosomal protein L13
MTRKLYHRHTGHPGGIKTTTPEKILASKFPERVFELAVKRMMPGESPLARKQFAKLRVYGGADHPHTAQNPEKIDFKSMNSKNVKVA